MQVNYPDGISLQKSMNRYNPNNCLLNTVFMIISLRADSQE